MQMPTEPSDIIAEATDSAAELRFWFVVLLLIQVEIWQVWQCKKK